MTLRHVYAAILKIEKPAGKGCYVTLDDGTLLGLPLAAEPDYRDFKKGDRVLVDASNWSSDMKGSADITVFREGRHYRSFRIGGHCQLNLPEEKISQPRYLVLVDGERQFMTAQKVADALTWRSRKVEILKLVLEVNLSVRTMRDDEYKQFRAKVKVAS